MKKTKVLFLLNSLGNGGAERVLVNLVNNMDFSKYDVTVRTMIKGGANENYLDSSIKAEYVFKKGFHGINYLDRIPGIYKYVVPENYDVIIAYLHGVWTRILSKAPYHQRTIAYLHANMHESSFMKDLIRRGKTQECFLSFDRIVAVSESVRQSFIEETRISQNTCVKYNTFNIPFILESAKDTDYKLIRNENNICLCAVGKLEMVKGYDRLIRVLSRLRDEGINYTLNIVGDGVEHDRLKRLVCECDLEDKVKFCGFQVNPYKYIAHSDMFVCSSRSEGFSSVVAESIILGIPVVTTDCSGMREMLGENNEYGVVVENSENGLYSILKTMHENHELFEAYKEKVKLRASFFSIENTVHEVEKMIDEVLA